MFPADPREAMEPLSQYLEEILGWMRISKLNLKPDKTEVILVLTFNVLYSLGPAYLRDLLLAYDSLGAQHLRLDGRQPEKGASWF